MRCQTVAAQPLRVPRCAHSFDATAVAAIEPAVVTTATTAAPWWCRACGGICLLAWMGRSVDIEGRGLGELSTYNEMFSKKLSHVEKLWDELYRLQTSMEVLFDPYGAVAFMEQKEEMCLIFVQEIHMRVYTLYIECSRLYISGGEETRMKMEDKSVSILKQHGEGDEQRAVARV
nr:hypothetical protein [Tanacetum cinerariifolium]